MEAKVIFYVLAGIGYLIYSAYKAVKENNEKKQQQQQKPVQPSVTNPFEEITRELKRKQAEAEAKRRQIPQPQAKPKQATKTRPAVKPSDVLVHEKKSTLFQEGVTNYESTYERELTAEDKIVRGNLKVENEGVYRIETIEEQEARETTQNSSAAYKFDPRNAIIGSIILERKF